MSKGCFIVLFYLISFNIVSAQEYTQGLGVKLGSYIGASYQQGISENSAFEGVAAFDWTFNTLGIMANYHIVHTELYNEWEGLDWYAGLGGQLWLGNASSIGPSAVTGLEYTFKDAPFSLFADFTLYLGLGNSEGVYPQVGLGARKNF